MSRKLKDNKYFMFPKIKKIHPNKSGRAQIQYERVSIISRQVDHLENCNTRQKLTKKLDYLSISTDAKLFAFDNFIPIPAFRNDAHHGHFLTAERAVFLKKQISVK